MRRKRKRRRRRKKKKKGRRQPRKKRKRRKERRRKRLLLRNRRGILTCPKEKKRPFLTNMQKRWKVGKRLRFFRSKNNLLKGNLNLTKMKNITTTTTGSISS